MASIVSAPTLLQNLPARPPTPPRDPIAQDATEVSLKSLLGRPTPFDSRLSLQTPPNANSSASSAATHSGQSSGQMGKRVGWSNHTEYREPPVYTNGLQPHKSSPSSFPSSSASKPVKGILKPSSSPNILVSSLANQLDGQENQINLTDMLDSTIKQLAGPDRDSKLDAYMMLARALKASNNLPDRVALQEKMSLFTQFIQRDVTSKLDSGSLDTSLVNHALTLLATFLHFPAIASRIASDFAVFIIDHSIRSFEDTSLPKDVARHFMQVVAFQDFSAKVMTLDRVGRLLASLHNIENHLKGKSIVMSRIQIYKRLVKQCRNHMTVHSDWLKDMFTDMLSNIRDIRAQAISLGMEAGYSLRSGIQSTRKVTEILQSTDNDQSYIEFYIQKLEEMGKDKQRCAVVPQIWSVVILFLRCPLEKWEFYAPWFSLIQAAFNTSDHSTKQEANYAWNRYVYLSLVDSRVSSKTLSALCQPYLSQLRRKPSVKQPEEGSKLRRTVISGVCNLYYYAFRPGNDRFMSPDVVWDVTISPVVSQLVGLDNAREPLPEDVMQASRILVGLLDVATPVVWRDDRIADIPPVRPDELPSIESKWIRKNSERIFKVVGPILERKFLDLANKESLTCRLWQALLGSVAAASAKDIKVSEDTLKFLAASFSLLSHIWSKGCQADQSLLTQKFFPSFHNFVKILHDALGMLPFTEKKLSMTVENTFEPVATPSQRPNQADKTRGVVRNPLHHLFSILIAIPPGVSDDEHFADFFQSVFEPFFAGKDTKARLSLARELCRLSPPNTLSPYAAWTLEAQAVRLSLDTASGSGAVGLEKLPGPEFREVLSLLERGLLSHPNLPLDHWSAVFELLSSRVSTEFGDAGRAIVITEPFAKALYVKARFDSEQSCTRSLTAAGILFESAKLPRDRQAFEAAHRKIWGAPPSLAKGTSGDPFDNLYELGNHALKSCYDSLVAANTVHIAAFMRSLATFLVGSFPQAGLNSLSKLQDGLSVWLQDEKTRFQLVDESALTNSVSSIYILIVHQVLTLRQLPDLFGKICSEISCRGPLNKDQLSHVEQLLTAAFKSEHSCIVKKAADTWNVIAKDEEQLECSDSLKSAVSSVRSRLDAELPRLDSSSGEFGAQTTFFMEVADDHENIHITASESNDKEQSTSSNASSLRKRRDGMLTTTKRQVVSTPEKSRFTRRSYRASRTSTPRQRHNNSQIQFEPIVSSSPGVEESQHLTEHQIEVRERQKTASAMYSDMQSSSPGVVDVPMDGKSPSPQLSKDKPEQETTPQRATSYGELITSTPTPRRGQVVQIEGYNDPPSSPPEPRPYPLLSEIRSRSRASSSLENWEFSSPPGSPSQSQQEEVVEMQEVREVQQTRDIQLEQKAAGDTTGGRPLRKSTRAKRTSSRQKKNSSHTADAMTSSAGPGAIEDVVDVEPVQDEVSKNASFALSEGDDSHLMRLLTDLESTKQKIPQGQEDTTKGMESAIIVERVPGREDTEPRVATETITNTPSSPEGERSEVSLPSAGRKRKRGTKKRHDGRKKRRSLESESAQKATDPEQTISPSTKRQPDKPSLATAGVRTRRSTRKQEQEQKQEEVEEALHEDAELASASQKDGGDTDEELMSQLITESNAASESFCITNEEQVEGHDMDTDNALESGSKTTGVGEVNIEEGESADGILDALRSGLGKLRNANLSRADVYKIEDLLMDVKRELYEAEHRGRESSG